MGVDCCNGKEDQCYGHSEIMVAGNRPCGECSLADLPWFRQSEFSCLGIFTVLACMKRKPDVCFYYKHCNDRAKCKWWMYKFQPCKLLLCMQGWCVRQFLGVEMVNPLGVACSSRTIKVVELILWVVGFTAAGMVFNSFCCLNPDKDFDYLLLFHRHLGFGGLVFFQEVFGFSK